MEIKQLVKLTGHCLMAPATPVFAGKPAPTGDRAGFSGFEQDGGYCFDLHQHAVQRQPGHRYQRAGRFHVRPPGPVGLGHPLVQARFGVLDNQQGQLEHLGQAGTCLLYTSPSPRD